jgi:DNA invertase Pin-like site-specific DNA recombinase
MAPSTPKQLHPSQIGHGPIGFGYTQDERPFMYTEQVHNMTQQQFVSYFRVSTARQGISGLGLDAQRQTVTQFLAGGTKTVLAEFVEVETGKGSNALVRRPELRAALDLCKKSGATLLIAKLDRLARNVHFVSGLMESKVKFVACDLPEANQLTIHIMAAFAEHEARRISERTRDALAAAKARGVVLGATGPANLKRHTRERQAASSAFNARLMPLLSGFASQGLSRRAMVAQLNGLGIAAPRGGAWSLGQVQRVTKSLCVQMPEPSQCREYANGSRNERGRI